MSLSAQEGQDARQHKPLWFALSHITKGSSRLEKHGVNVWGSPLSLGISQNFFETGEKDSGAQKLKKLGLRVDRYSMVPKHAAVPHVDESSDVASV